MTAAIHGVQLGKVGMGTAVVTPLDPVGRYAGIGRLFCFRFCHAGVKISPPNFIKKDLDPVPWPQCSWIQPG
jgi:hypothetical protein